MTEQMSREEINELVERQRYMPLDLRDYFAAAAIHMVNSDAQGKEEKIDMRTLARRCYMVADAMLSARGESK